MSGRPDYAARKAARVERLENQAERLRGEGEAKIGAARSLANRIPLGQPILAGHHSEKRARRDAERIHDGYAAGFEKLKQADETARRAESAASNTAINSDDPEALTLLREKLAGLGASRERWKAILKALRKQDAAALKVMTLTADELTTLKFATGVPTFKLTNLGAEIRRCQKRIAELETAATKETPADETIGDIVIHEEFNRVQIRFPGKPSEAIRADLKSNGFHWSPSEGVWQRKASNGAWYAARTIAAKVTG